MPLAAIATAASTACSHSRRPRHRRRRRRRAAEHSRAAEQRGAGPSQQLQQLSSVAGWCTVMLPQSERDDVFRRITAALDRDTE